MATTGAPPQGRFQQLISNLPLVTLMLLVINIGVYIGMNVGDFYADIVDFALNAHAVVFSGQVYRIVTAQFMHGGLLHIGFNMMTLVQFGAGLEPMFGSLQYVFITTIFVFFTGTVYVILAMFTSVVYRAEYASQLTVGFSGVLFAMAVDEASLSPFPTRSVYGLFSVPTWVYPWVLMLILQLMVPGVSLLGHLSGCIVGLLHARGFFRVFIPTIAFLRKIEDAAWFHRIRTLPSYKLMPLAPILREDMPIAQHFAYACGPVLACCRSRGGLQLPSIRPAQSVDVEAGLPLQQHQCLHQQHRQRGQGRIQRSQRRPQRRRRMDPSRLMKALRCCRRMRQVMRVVRPCQERKWLPSLRLRQRHEQRRLRAEGEVLQVRRMAALRAPPRPCRL